MNYLMHHGSLVPDPGCLAVAAELGLVTLIEEDDDGELLDEPYYEVAEEVADGHDDSIGPVELTELVRLLTGPVAKVRTFVKGPPMTDAEALDALAYILSAPSWSVSFLEDIACVVAQSGRSTDIPGAQWDSH